MITVHHLENSRSQRVLWLLEELEVPYEVRRYERDGETMLAPPALRAVHPLGKSPVITDGGATIAETGTILEYLIARHGGDRLAPREDDPSFWTYRHWMHHAEGSAMPPLVMALIFATIPEKAPALLRPLLRPIFARVNDLAVTPNLERLKTYWNDALAGTGWFAGPDLTAADVMMSFPLEAAASRSPFGPHRPHPTAFLSRIHARPAYRRALERGGPYALAG